MFASIMVFANDLEVLTKVETDGNMRDTRVLDRFKPLEE
jgi:hypothetical protein